MWEEFWGERVPHAVLARTTAFSSSPRRSREAERDGLDLLPKQYEAFWEAFAEAVDDDVAEAVLALVDDPAPLVAELDACGTTLIHADIRDEQIGLDGDRLDPARLGPRQPGPPGGRPLLVDLPQRLADRRRATTSWSRTSAAPAASTTTRAPSSSA